MQFHLTGVAPLLMHAAVMSNPLHPLKKLQASITSKRKKSDDDHAEIARIDWLASLYYDDTVGVHIPGQNIERMLVDAAKLQKLGKLIQQAITVPDNMIPLIYSGPSDPDNLFKNLAFVDVRSVRNQQVRVQRCRPIFREWKMDVTIEVDTDLINEATITEIMDNAGKRIGLCDFRPRFGRFTSERVQ